MANYDDNNHTWAKGTKEIQALMYRSNFCVQKKGYKKLAKKWRFVYFYVAMLV